jgi:LytS/YehU family sensor histidine kinase
MLLRESLRNNDKEMVPLVTEVNLLETYLRLEQLRFNFKYEINIDQAIDKNATEIPYLILQPLVENAVKHGVSTLAEKGLIKIDFIKREHNLLVLITDNGNKFDETQATDGFGLKLTKSRISLLSQSLKEQPIKLTIERRQDMETIVNLVFTNWV